jgi:hypothetical protein
MVTPLDPITGNFQLGRTEAELSVVKTTSVSTPRRGVTHCTEHLAPSLHLGFRKDVIPARRLVLTAVMTQPSRSNSLRSISYRARAQKIWKRLLRRECAEATLLRTAAL